jgi:hypothetical protein
MAIYGLEILSGKPYREILQNSLGRDRHGVLSLLHSDVSAKWRPNSVNLQEHGNEKRDWRQGVTMSTQGNSTDRRQQLQKLTVSLYIDLPRPSLWDLLSPSLV